MATRRGRWVFEIDLMTIWFFCFASIFLGARCSAALISARTGSESIIAGVSGAAGSGQERLLYNARVPVTPAGWERYYEIVRRIPRGRVTTYGVVARIARQPRTARHVGWALAALHGKKAIAIPWHRVMGVRGRGFAAISVPPDAGGKTQRRRLAAEGVLFDARGRVSLERYGWSG